MTERATPRGAGATMARRLDWTAVVLTGGSSRRMGRDKAGVHLAGRTLLEHVISGLPDVPMVIVGPEPEASFDLGRRTSPVAVCREEPPGTGPAAAVAAALPLVQTPWFALIGTDMPLAGTILVELAGRALAESDASPDAIVTDAWLALDGGGTPQPLCGVYRTEAARAAVAQLPTEDAAGLSLRRLLAPLRVRPVGIEDPGRLRDLDTPDDLAAAQAILGGEEMIAMDKTQDFVALAAAELGIDDQIDTTLVLDVARDVAHGVERPAAPLSTYLLGVAVGQGLDPQAAADRLRAAIARSTS